MGNLRRFKYKIYFYFKYVSFAWNMFNLFLYQELEMKGSIKRPKAKTKNSAVTAAPIFQRLLDGEDTRQLSKLVSCPNIAVKCDIVEYL